MVLQYRPNYNNTVSIGVSSSNKILSRNEFIAVILCMVLIKVKSWGGGGEVPHPIAAG